ncbi:MAG: hypothetical protein HUU20_16505 [Pirellulales bacterium]|nr:hypothetical protein [Pirellulales bacterium]
MDTRDLQTSLRTRTLGRREFLGAAGASALSLKLGILDFASSLFAGETGPAGKPRVLAVFLRPEGDRYWMSWPGASYDVEAHQNQYTQTLVEAAKKLGVELEIRPVPLDDADSIEAFVRQTSQSPPDGLFLSVMHIKSWPKLNYIVKNRGEAPAVVFSPLGTAFAKQVQALRGVPKTFVAATQDPQWPALGLRMLKTHSDMKRGRLCMIAGKSAEERPVKSLGTTLCYVPLDTWTTDVAQVDTTDEMRAIADYYSKEARQIIEPKQEDILAAAKNYVVARRMMEAEKCQGISVDCYPLLKERRVACGMCLAWSRLLDEGFVGACEADGDAAVSMLLSASLLGRPGFMQDPAPNTLRNTLIGSHCTCPTRLDGFENPHLPFVLRNQAESASGVALQVLWNPGQEITMMKFRAPDTIVLGTGRVVDNVEGDAATACRTSVEVKVNGLADARNVKDSHQLFLAGKWDEPIRAFAELAGLKVAGV